MKTVYSYGPDGAYVGSSAARENPRRKGEYLLPGNATFLEPPAASDNEVAVFENDAWMIKPDFRGVVYWLPDGSRHEITEIGVHKPANALNEAPEPEPLPLAAIDVKAECLRRRKALVGLPADAPTSQLDYIIQKGSNEAISLLDKKASGGEWTEVEVARAAQLRASREALEGLIEKSNALQALDPIPLDFADDKHWQ